jgi:hypothetical protein
MRVIVEQWDEDWQGKPKYSEKTCPSATLSTTKSHMTRPGLEPRAAAVGSQRLTAWAMTRPFSALVDVQNTWSNTATPPYVFMTCFVIWVESNLILLDFSFPRRWPWVMKDVTSCSSDTTRRFVGKYRFHRQCRRVNQIRPPDSAGLLICLRFDSEYFRAIYSSENQRK